MSTATPAATRAPYPIRVRRIHADTGPEALRATVALIGRGIRDGATFFPLRDHAARLVSRAGPKNYLGQLSAIFDDFLQRWRYVKDPLGTEQVTISGPAIYAQVLGMDARPGEHGRGDCDDSTVYLGAAARSVGAPVRIATIQKPQSPARLKYGSLFSHVFPQMNIPGRGWISVDAVGHPLHGLGWTPPHSRIAYWDLDGNLLGARGHFPSTFKNMLAANISGIVRGDSNKGVEQMSFAGITEDDFQDYGLENYGLAGLDYQHPPDEWADHVQIGFGALTDQPIPIINNDRLGLLMEYDDSDVVGYTQAGEPLIRTKMLEMAPEDIMHTWRHGTPRPGAAALSDDGDFYEWKVTPMGGFFSRVFSRVKGAVTKGARWLGSKAKSLIKKLPGGKYLVKIYGKIKSVAAKITKPLTKFLGSKFAKRIAPIVALVPGFGAPVAAALAKGGEIVALMKKMGIAQDDEKRPKFKSGKQAKDFKDRLTKMMKRKKKQMQEKKKKKKKKKRAKIKAKLARKMEKKMERRFKQREEEIRRQLMEKYGPRPDSAKRPRLIAPPPPRGAAGVGQYNPYNYYSGN